MDPAFDVLAAGLRRRPVVRRMWGTVTAVSSDLATVSFADGGTTTVRATGKLPTVDDVVQVEFVRGAMRIVGTDGGFA